MSGSSESLSSYRPECLVSVGDTLTSKATTYRVDRRIAHGTFATVFEAGAGDGARCALKVFAPDEDPADEVAAMRAAAHPNVLGVRELFFAGPTPVLAVPLLHSDLHTYTHRTDRVPVAVVRRFTRQLLAALAALDDANVVHTDLKPENILLSEPTPHARIVVSDFGSAVRSGQRARPYGHTLEYRSPEMIFGDRLSPASDVWAAGTIVAELLTGDFLFSPRESRGLDSDISASASSSSTVDDALDFEHVVLMVELLGDVPRKIARRNRRFFNARGALRDGVRVERMSIVDVLMAEARFPETEAAAIADFVLPMLYYTPARRPRATRHLAHPWLAAPEADMPATDAPARDPDPGQLEPADDAPARGPNPGQRREGGGPAHTHTPGRPPATKKNDAVVDNDGSSTPPNLIL